MLSFTPHNCTIAVTVLCATVLVLSSCSDNVTGTKPPLQIPATYDSATYSANTADAFVLRSSLAEFSALLKTARTAGVRLDASAIIQQFRLILRPATAPAGAERAEMLLGELAKASGNTYDPRKTPAENGEGGLYGGYIFDENGVDIHEAIEKALYASMFYARATEVGRQEPVQQAALDNIIALFGASPRFSNSNAATVQPDVFAAGYAARRDKNDGSGYYTTFKDAMIKAQAALKAGNDYKPELQQALIEARAAWEKSQMATVINYLYASLTAFSATNPDDKTLAGGLHSFGEAIGFVSGFRAVPAENRIITDAQIDDILAALNSPHDGTSKPHLFVTDAFNTISALENAVKKVQSVYNFTNAEIVDFRKNWVAEQGRK